MRACARVYLDFLSPHRAGAKFVGSDVEEWQYRGGEIARRGAYNAMFMTASCLARTDACICKSVHTVGAGRNENLFSVPTEGEGGLRGGVRECRSLLR